jgi:DNA-binding transcriptional MocR family regulator
MQQISGKTESNVQNREKQYKNVDLDIYKQLNGTDLKILMSIAYRAKRRAKFNPTKAAYCTPSQRTLGSNIGVSRETANKSTQKLHKLGIITKTQRRPVRGIFTTCMYVVNKPWTWRLISAMQSVLFPKRWKKKNRTVEVETKRPEHKLLTPSEGKITQRIQVSIYKREDRGKMSHFQRINEFHSILDRWKQRGEGLEDKK